MSKLNKIKIHLRDMFYKTLFGRCIRYIYYLLLNRKMLEKRMRFGDKNPDEIIYIIRPTSENGIQGLMSLFVQTLRKIDYAKKKRYIPVVDFKNYNTQYSDGKSNAWEFFFKQPGNISLEEAYESKNVILSGVSLFKRENFNLYKDTIFIDDRMSEYCYNIINNFIKYDEIVNKMVEEENDRIMVENCIGVYIRGTDYTKLKPPGEYIQPSINEVIEKINEFMKNDEKMNIFLVTEDLDNYKILKEKYSEKLKIVSYDNFIDSSQVSDFLSHENLLENDVVKRGRDYLVKEILLSKCKCLISSITYGSIAAFAINGNKYKDKYIFNKGKY